MTKHFNHPLTNQRNIWTYFKLMSNYTTGAHIWHLLFASLEHDSLHLSVLKNVIAIYILKQTSKVVEWQEVACHGHINVSWSFITPQHHLPQSFALKNTHKRIHIQRWDLQHYQTQCQHCQCGGNVWHTQDVCHKQVLCWINAALWTPAAHESAQSYHTILLLVCSIYKKSGKPLVIMVYWMYDNVTFIASIT